MLLYSSNFELLGMSKSVLDLVGYPSFGSFCSSYSDISDLFINKKGDETFYIESMLNSKKPLNVELKDRDNKVIKAQMYVEKIENYYVVFLSPSYKKEFSKTLQTLTLDRKYSNSFLISNIFRQSFSSEVKRLEEERFHNNANKDSVDMEWFLYTINKLGVKENSFLQMLDELVKYTDENSEFLHESLVFGDKSSYSNILDKIKDTSKSLGIKPLARSVYKLENSQISEISANFREYQGIITEIKKIIDKRNAS